MGRRNKPWFRQDVGWWVTNVRGKQIRLAKGKSEYDKKSKKEAERVFHEVMSLRPRRPDAHDARVCDIAEAFLDWAEEDCSPDTYRNYRFYIASFAEVCGHLSAANVLPRDVNRWVRSPKGRKDAPKSTWKKWNETTVYNARRIVFRLFTWAVDEGYLRENPIKKLKRPKPQPRQRCLTVEEWKALLGGAHGPFRVFLWALLQTGARPSELRSLTWDMYHGDRFVLSQHKTSKKTGTKRIIFLSDAMQRLVKRLHRKSESQHVFVNTRGEPWTGNAIRLQVDRIKKKKGLAADVCAYMVRHTFGTWMIMSGVDIATVAQLMGHRDTEMIIKVYSHLAQHYDHMKAAANHAGRFPALSTPDAKRRHRAA